ncbi:hypothetical protein VTN31DRAFT_6886 [Thermomyces dupontii]|uniref:uncharacterized protein n=1 Tax=Talaromyces thermophilus TaxID=28565 RepID=UPI003742DEC3
MPISVGIFLTQEGSEESMETVTIPQADNAPEHLLNVREEALFDVLADMEDGLAFSPRLEGRLKRVTSSGPPAANNAPGFVVSSANVKARDPSSRATLVQNSFIFVNCIARHRLTGPFAIDPTIRNHIYLIQLLHRQ